MAPLPCQKSPHLHPDLPAMSIRRGIRLHKASPPRIPHGSSRLKIEVQALLHTDAINPRWSRTTL